MGYHAAWDVRPFRPPTKQHGIPCRTGYPPTIRTHGAICVPGGSAVQQERRPTSSRDTDPDPSESSSAHSSEISSSGRSACRSIHEPSSRSRGNGSRRSAHRKARLKIAPSGLCTAKPQRRSVDSISGSAWRPFDVAPSPAARLARASKRHAARPRSHGRHDRWQTRRQSRASTARCRPTQAPVQAADGCARG